MIHSARPIVTPVANIIFSCFVLLDLKSGDGRTTCAKTRIPTGRDFGLAEWINYLELKLMKNTWPTFASCSSLHEHFIHYILQCVTELVSVRGVDFNKRTGPMDFYRG